MPKQPMKLKIKDNPENGPNVNMGDRLIVEQPGKPAWYGVCRGWSRVFDTLKADIKICPDGQPDLPQGIYGDYIRIDADYVYLEVPEAAEDRITELESQLAAAIDALRDVITYDDQRMRDTAMELVTVYDAQKSVGCAVGDNDE